MGNVDIKISCLDFDSNPLDPHAVGIGTLYEGVSYGVAATVLSLSTNLFATIAVAVKAWYDTLNLNLSCIC